MAILPYRYCINMAILLCWLAGTYVYCTYGNIAILAIYVLQYHWYTPLHLTTIWYHIGIAILSILGTKICGA